MAKENGDVRMNPSQTKLSKPVFLLGDCDLLRSTQGLDGDKLWLTRLLDYCETPDPRVACVSIDQRVEQLGLEFSSVIVAMKQLGVTDCRLVSAHPDQTEKEWLFDADLLVIIGSNSLSERQTFFKSQLFDMIHEVVEQGVTVMAVADGAESLGYWQEDASGDSLMPGLELIPAMIRLQEEAEPQPQLKEWINTLTKKDQPMVGLGVCYGGAVIIHPGFKLEPIGMPMSCLTPIDDEIEQELVIPEPCLQRHRLH
ncbi:hypothetical protein [Pelagibaculum spongiae]|uniref:Uncharacterized protein n=1 Tax=Pelagibaculum spongiae TaxID=2080658 RepID=A0A2V1GZ71_9GAMM|nr:hypothetical protein [Pelagibaculum spongiae]PVZ68356.1 hypothetical protein DC094_13820 [Pelagibaculum spongiae]